MIHENLTNAEYHNDTTAISKSGLDLIERAPILYRRKYFSKLPIKNKTVDPGYFIAGTAFHSFILEPEKLEDEFVVKPIFMGEGSRKREIDFNLSNSNKNIIDLPTFKMVSGMRDSVLANPTIKRAGLLANGRAELSFFWNDPATGVRCKCRPDYLNDYIVDLKSTDNASEIAVNRTIKKYNYHKQGAFYLDGVRAAGLKPKGFVFIFVEKTPPYLVNVFLLSSDDADAGREKYNENLKTFSQCNETGVWPGYSAEIKLTNAIFRK